MTQDEIHSRAFLANIIIQAWSDSTVLNALKNNPIPTLTSFGLNPPPGLSIKIHVDDTTNKYIIADARWSETHGNDFMDLLRTSPSEALASLGYNIDGNVTYNVVFNENNTMNIIIPLQPSMLECSIEKIR